ncbi:MAG TPA: hypothetical protein VIZ65_05820 [Cellvibrionaceae bacterium]
MSLCWLSSNCVQAATNSVQADGLPFGRLFNTPEQRLQLDHLRQSGPANGGETVADADGAAQSFENVRLSGVIIRADGQQSLWLNGQLQQQSQRAPKHSILGVGQQSQTLRVRVGAPGRVLKPGQVWQPGNKGIQEGYQLPPVRPVAPADEPAASAPATVPATVPAAAAPTAPEIKTP